mmetsp:Transcript_1421/g.4834  ORF Transcript_1421/g.4834 Transcript_1421/m.4834 type:complete len:277 (-) Transcript_1421:81-911(-)
MARSRVGVSLPTSIPTTAPACLPAASEGRRMNTCRAAARTLASVCLSRDASASASAAQPSCCGCRAWAISSSRACASRRTCEHESSKRTTSAGKCGCSEAEEVSQASAQSPARRASRASCPSTRRRVSRCGATAAPSATSVSLACGAPSGLDSSSTSEGMSPGKGSQPSARTAATTTSFATRRTFRFPSDSAVTAASTEAARSAAGGLRCMHSSAACRTCTAGSPAHFTRAASRSFSASGVAPLPRWACDRSSSAQRRIPGSSSRPAATLAKLAIW